MMPAQPHDQLIRLASDAASIYDDARRWFLSRGQSIVPVLVEGLEDKRLGSVGHWRILLLLRELGLPSTLPVILKAFHAALEEKNPIVLPGAMEALAIFDSDEAMSALISVLGSGDADFINHAAVLLGDKGGKRALDALTTLLPDQNPRVRQSAVRGLLKIHTDVAREILRQHRRIEKDPGVLKLIGDLQ
jgi:HEAT repeat protein